MTWKITSDVSEILAAELRADPVLARMVAEEHINGDIAKSVYDARLALGLTHAQMAKAPGLKAADIRDVENNDFDGDMLAGLREVALVYGFDLKLELRQKPHAKRTVRCKSA